MSKEFDEFMKSVEYPELEGTMNLCNDMTEKRTGKMTEEEWQAAERTQTTTKTETTADYVDRLFVETLMEFDRETNSVPYEISDEEIETAAKDYHRNNGVYYGQVKTFIDAIKWYREQLKKK